ncbi:hypothetical protein ANRL3_01771 [Anaerolineae bacterium]|nr:hypothetical protein ANRL3_01771 [Anaerolineae bacterium]
MSILIPKWFRYLCNLADERSDSKGKRVTLRSRSSTARIFRSIVGLRVYSIPDESLCVAAVIFGCELPLPELTNLDILESATTVFRYIVVIIPVHN